MMYRQLPRLNMYYIDLQKELWHIGPKVYEDIINRASEKVQEFLVHLEYTSRLSAFIQDLVKHGKEDDEQPDIADYLEPDSEDAFDKERYLQSLQGDGGSKDDVSQIRLAARLAYDAIQDDSFLPGLKKSLGPRRAQKIFRSSQLLARPMTAGNMLETIASRMPKDKAFKIKAHSPPPAVALNERFIVPIEVAWKELGLPLDNEIRSRLANWNSDFRRDISRRFAAHTEVQLLTYYLKNPQLRPTFNYFGCSKKACLLCEGLLKLSPSPFRPRMRGSHGKCYPDWGIPVYTIFKLEKPVRVLADVLVVRIRKSQETGALLFEDPGADSTLLSSLSE